MKPVRWLRSRYISGRSVVEHFLALHFLASERVANGHQAVHVPNQPNHVTWTRQHPIMQGGSIDFIAFGRITTAAKLGNLAPLTH